MEQTKKSTFKLLFYLKKNELKKNGNAPIMARITIDGTAKTLGTKLEIDPNNWDLKYGRVEGKSATALSINKKTRQRKWAYRQDIRRYAEARGLCNRTESKTFVFGCGCNG